MYLVGDQVVIKWDHCFKTSLVRTNDERERDEGENWEKETQMRQRTKHWKQEGTGNWKILFP